MTVAVRIDDAMPLKNYEIDVRSLPRKYFCFQSARGSEIAKKNDNHRSDGMIKITLRRFSVRMYRLVFMVRAYLSVNKKRIESGWPKTSGKENERQEIRWIQCGWLVCREAPSRCYGGGGRNFGMKMPCTVRNSELPHTKQTLTHNTKVINSINYCWH